MTRVKVGAILGLIGSTVFLIAGLFTIAQSRLFYYPPGDPMAVPISIFYITGIANIALGSVGIVGVVLAFRDINIAGYILLLVAGAAGIVGTFIPIYIRDDGYGWITFYYLCATALYGDLILMVIGGILGFALAPKKGRPDY